MTRRMSGPTVALLLAAAAILPGCKEEKKFAIEPPTEYGVKSNNAETAVPAGQTGTPDTSVPPATAGGAGDTPPTTSDPGSTTTPTAETSPPPIPDASAGNSSPVTLRFAFAKGAEIKFKSSSETSSPSMGGGSASPMSTSSVTTAKVVDNTGNKSRIEMTVSNMSMDMGNAGDNPEAKKAMQKMAKENENVKVSAVFDAYGKPSDIKYLQGTKLQAMSAGLDSNTGFFGLTYPDKQVKPGDTWNHTFDFRNVIGAFGPMASASWANSTITTVFTLKSVDVTSGTAVIGISAKGTPSVSVKVPTAPGNSNTKAGSQPQEMKMDFKVNGAGTATVDLKTGIPNEITYEMVTEFPNPMSKQVISQKTKATLKRM